LSEFKLRKNYPKVSLERNRRFPTDIRW